MSNVTITAGQLFTNCEGGPAIIRVTEVHADGSVTAVHAHLANPITYLPGSLQSQVASGALTEVAPTAPAPLDIPAAVTEYIEAECRGTDRKARYAMRGEIIAALLAADPSLSNTAATFRFHNLVAEMRDNGEISAETLVRIKPVTDTAAELAARVRNGADDVTVTMATPETLALLQSISDAPEATVAGARILRRFVTDARVAELNGGTLIFGGRSEASAVRKLVRDGLLERVRETPGCRLTDAGRAWLTANSAAYRML